MGWQDRSYYRDSSHGTGNPLMWLWFGSLPLFTAFGIRVKAHATLILTIILVLLFGWGRTVLPWTDRLISALALFTIILLHEFGHCFAARYVGGEADEIVMHPLGGLALTRPPQRPWPNFVTVAGGPLVNVLICVATGAVLWGFFGFLPWNPFTPSVLANPDSSFWIWGRWVYWTYWTSWMLLAFNLMPIFPLDGGQMLQCALWPRFGYFRSMYFSCMVGMIAAAVGGSFALVTGNIGLAIMAGLGFYYCFTLRRQLLAMQHDLAGAEGEVDYSSSLFEPSHHEKHKHRPLSKRMIRKAQRREAKEREEQERVDQILAKVSAHGLASLTWWERRTLRKATQRERQRDEELREVGKKWD